MKGSAMRLPALPAACLAVFLAAGVPASAQVAIVTSEEPAVPLRVAPPGAATTPVAAAAIGEASESVMPLLADPSALLPLAGQPTPVGTSPAPTLAFEYSEGYRQRAKIHKIASFTTIPIFATEAILGQSLYSNPTEGKRSAHVAVSAVLGGLFAVNTFTGVWNLLEARKDPHFGKKKWAHALLMMGADVGFLGAAALAPESEHGTYSDSRDAHRAVAISAIAMATTGYLIMLFGN